MPQKHPIWATSAATILVLAAGTSGIDSQAAETEETVAVTDRRIVFDSGDSLLRPSVLPAAEGYRMWYTAVERPPKDDPLFRKYPWMVDETHIWEIRYATSTDGTNWTAKGTVLRPGLYDGRRTIQVLMPEVIVDGDILRMYLTVREDTTAHYRLMQCQSQDGITWTDPVMAMDTGEKGRPDDGHTSGCSVLKENGVYRMWYGAYCLEDRKFRTMYAESADGTTWRRGDVVLDTGDEGQPDSDRAYRPCVRRRNGRYTMLYTGIADRTLRGPYTTMWATSDDGLKWEKRGLVIDAGEKGMPDERRAYDPYFLPHPEGGYHLWYIGAAADKIRRICHARMRFSPQQAQPARP